MEFFSDLIQYGYLSNALAACVLSGITCGVVGTYVVCRRMVFLAGGITHASFGGIGIGVFLGVSPILSAMVFSVLSAFGIQWLSSRGNVREDSAIAVFWALGMSVGILFCFLAPGFVPDLPSFLFGSILTIESGNLWLLAALCVITLFLFTAYYRIIVSTAFDPEFARSQRLPVSLVEYTMMALIAMTIVSTLRMVGIVLAMSMLTIPQMTANLFTYSFGRIAAYSILIGCAGCMAGLALSYWLNVPSGASIIFVSIIIYCICKAIKYALKQLNKSETSQR